MCHDNKHVRRKPITRKVIEAAIAQAKIDARQLATLRETLKNRGSLAEAHAKPRQCCCPSHEAALSKAYERIRQENKIKAMMPNHQVDLDRARAAPPPAEALKGPGEARAELDALKRPSWDAAAVASRIAELEMQHAGLEAATVAEKKRERAGRPRCRVDGWMDLQPPEAQEDQRTHEEIVLPVPWSSPLLWLLLLKDGWPASSVQWVRQRHGS
ncbi:hypothetical protein HDK64DRAFT_258580 [Phyllosticta capitalensis]